MQKAIKARKHKPIFAVDIAVPRDLDPEISKLRDVYLYTVDDLDRVIVEGQANRESAAVDAMRILEEETRRYLDMERSREVAPLIAALRDNADAMRKDILAQGMKRLKNGADQEEVLEYVTASLMKKMLHHPTVRLRQAGEAADQEFIAAARGLFGIDDKK